MTGKTGVFVPFEGKREALVNYFENDGVRHLGGLPVSVVSLPADATEEEVVKVAEEFAFDNYVDSNEYAFGDEPDFIDVFEVDGEPVGWEVDLRVWELNWML